MDKTRYKITWHFDDTTISSFYESEQKRDDAFDMIEYQLKHGTQYFDIGETVVNANKAICITKGDDEEWKSVKCH